MIRFRKPSFTERVNDFHDDDATDDEDKHGEQHIIPPFFPK